MVLDKIWNLVQRVSIPEETSAYANFDEYIRDEPIRVFYNGEDVGFVDKIIDTHRSENTITYTLSYNPLQISEILKQLGLDGMPDLIFNGSDVVINGRKTRKVYVPLPVRLISETGDMLTYTYKNLIQDTNMSAMEHKLDLDAISSEAIKHLSKKSPGLIHMSIENIDIVNNEIIINVSSNAYRQKRVEILGEYAGETTINQPIILQYEETWNYTDEETTTEKGLALEVVNSLLPNHISVLHVEDSIGMDGLPQFTVQTRFNYDYFDQNIARPIRELLAFAQEKGYPISERIVHEFLLQKEGANETD